VIRTESKFSKKDFLYIRPFLFGPKPEHYTKKASFSSLVHPMIQRSVRSANRRIRRKKDGNGKRSGEGLSESAAGSPWASALSQFEEWDRA
jgi:hypothetical protein